MIAALPRYGVFEDLVKDEVPDSVERFTFWLLLHTTPSGEAVMDKLVRERGVQEIDAPLEFAAAGELI